MFGIDNDVGLPAGEVVAGEVVAGEVATGARNPSEDRDLFPDVLETTPVGPYLGAILASVDVGRLNGHDAVRFLKACARMESHYAAQRLAAIAEIAFCPPSGRSADVVRDTDQLEFAAAEVAAAIHVTRRSADRDLGTALSLKRRLPQVFEALSTGLIDLARARVIDVETCVLDQAAAQSVVHLVLDDASRLTTGQLRARLQRVVMEEAPGASKAKYEEGIETRALVREANPDGTATLIGMQLPPNRAGTAMARINRWAQKLKRSGDPRGIDQIRADVFLDLLNGRQLSDGAARGVVELRVELTTLAGLDERPGEIAGFGPVLADVARETAAAQLDSEWRYVVEDDKGNVVHVGTTTRRPTSMMRRIIEAQYPRCAHPGCRMPASQCDLDHRIPYSVGGPTCTCNLTPLCRHHHRARHGGGWTYRRDGEGQYQWTSPLAHHHTSNGRSP